MTDQPTPLDKLNEAIKASWEKNASAHKLDPISWRIHEQAFIDGMRYALKTDGK